MIEVTYYLSWWSVLPACNIVAHNGNPILLAFNELSQIPLLILSCSPVGGYLNVLTFGFSE